MGASRSAKVALENERTAARERVRHGGRLGESREVRGESVLGRHHDARGGRIREEGERKSVPACKGLVAGMPCTSSP